MPYDGEVLLTPAELTARGILPPGPLAPAIQAGNSPSANEAAIRATINPDPQAVIQQKVTSGVRGVLAKGDEWLSGAREGTKRMMLPPGVSQDDLSKMGTAGKIGAFGVDALNPVPGSVAQLAATAATAPFGGGVFSGPLKRTAAAGIAGGAVEGLQGKNPLASGLKYAVPQAIAEAPFAVGRGIANQRAYGKAEAARLKQSEFNKGFTKTLGEADQQAFKGDVAAAKEGQMTARRTHAQAGAASVAADFKTKVPSWAGIPPTEAGLVDMVYGSGQQKLSDSFDKGMKAAIADAKGKLVPLPLASIEALHVEPKSLVIAQGGARYIPGAKQQPPSQPTHANVDAAELIEAMTGKSSNSRIAYRHAAEALDAAGIGDPKIRAEYKSGQALIQFADRSGMLRGGQFNPEAAMKGLTTLKTVDQLRRRGEGDAVTGPLADTTKDIPSKTVPPESMPVPPQPRIVPPEPQLPDGFTVRQVPEIFRQHPWATSSLGLGIAGGAMGAGHPAAGALADAALLGGLALGGKKFATEAPLNPLLEQLLRFGPVGFGNQMRGNQTPEP